jgi:capsular polysaccharide transport system permease protein
MTAKEAVSETARRPAVVIPLGKTRTIPLPRSRNLLSWARQNWVLASALVCIALPTALVTLYLLLIATPRYAVEVRFSVRGQETPAVDVLGVLGSFGGGGGGMVQDSYVVIDYVLGRGIIEDMAGDVDVRKLYTKDSIDWFSRLREDEKIEDVVEYWKSRVAATYEPSTSIIRIEVTTFDPNETVQLANAITNAVDRLINHLSTESRRDALKAATTEVERAEQRQRMLRTAMRKFREQEQTADPVRRAGFQQEMIEKSKAELTRIETELQAARSFMKDDAPSIVVLKNQREAVIKQLEGLRKEVSGETAGATDKSPNSTRTVARMLSFYEELEAERLFAEKAYLTALASLERARYEADRKVRYLAIFGKAAMPEDAKYPRILRDIFMTAAGSALLWAIGLFFVMGAREHA